MNRNLEVGGNVQAGRVDAIRDAFRELTEQAREKSRLIGDFKSGRKAPRFRGNVVRGEAQNDVGSNFRGGCR